MSRTKLFLALAPVLILIAAPLAASAQDAPPNPNALTQEFISPMGEPFRAHSVDPYPTEAWFKGADKDGDGVVTKAEFRADAERFFKVLDKDGDGVLDEKEIKVYEEQVAPEIITAMGADPNAMVMPGVNFDDYRGPQGEAPVSYVDTASRIGDAHARDSAKAQQTLATRRGAGVFGFFDLPEPVRACDTNIDFRISLREWMAAADDRFQALDVHHDGKLVRAELPTTPFQRAMARRKR